MPEMIQVPNDLKIALGARELKVLLDIAMRAPVTDGERMLLERISDDVAVRAANLYEQRRRDLARQEAEDSQRALQEQESRAAASKAEVEKLDAQNKTADNGLLTTDDSASGQQSAVNSQQPQKAGESGNKSDADDTRKPANPKAVSGPASQEKQ